LRHYGRPRPFNLYVIRLREECRARVIRSLNERDRTRVDSMKPCVYVGYSSLTPEGRREHHLAGGRTSALIVRDCDDSLIPELLGKANPVAYTEAEALEQDVALAELLRKQGLPFGDNMASRSSSRENRHRGARLMNTLGQPAARPMA